MKHGGITKATWAIAVLRVLLCMDLLDSLDNVKKPHKNGKTLKLWEDKDGTTALANKKKLKNVNPANFKSCYITYN